MNSVCDVKFTGEGDVYAIGYNYDDRKNLVYKVLKHDFKLIHEGTIESPDGGEISCSPGNLALGKNGDFFIPVNWVMYHGGGNGYSSTGYVHHVKPKENQNSVVFKKDDIHFDKVFLGKDMTRLYVSSYRTWSNDRHRSYAHFWCTGI